MSPWAVLPVAPFIHVKLFGCTAAQYLLHKKMKQCVTADWFWWLSPLPCDLIWLLSPSCPLSFPDDVRRAGPDWWRRDPHRFLRWESLHSVWSSRMWPRVTVHVGNVPLFLFAVWCCFLQHLKIHMQTFWSLKEEGGKKQLKRLRKQCPSIHPFSTTTCQRFWSQSQLSVQTEGKVPISFHHSRASSQPAVHIWNTKYHMGSMKKRPRNTTCISSYASGPRLTFFFFVLFFKLHCETPVMTAC